MGDAFQQAGAEYAEVLAIIDAAIIDGLRGPGIVARLAKAGYTWKKQRVKK